MSNKLTESRLLELITEVLEENMIKVSIPGVEKGTKINTKKRNFHTDFGSSVPKISKKDFEKLSGLDDVPTDFTPSDLYNAFLDPGKNDVYKAASNLKRGTKAYRVAATSAEELANQIKADQAPEVKDIDAFDPGQPTQKVTAGEIESMAFKQLQTISADPANESTNLGKFPEGLATASDVVFEGVDTFEKRIQKISELMNLVYKPLKGGYKGSAAEIVAQYPSQSKLLATVLFLDYISTLVREVDSGAAAYQFEAMLALLAGGRVTGKQKTAEGKMGATDFVTNKGVRGSSKYYAKVGLSDIKQAVGGFDVNVPYIYIVAHKKGKEPSSAITKGTSDPREITTVDIYLLTVITPDRENFVIRNADGQLIYRPKTGKDIKLGGVETMVNPITLTMQKNTKDSRSFREQLKQKIAVNLDSDHKKAIQAYELVSKNAYVADEKMKAFMSTGNTRTGDDALRAMMQMEKGVSMLAPVFDPSAKYKQQIKKGISGTRLEEKKSKKDLDKLIKEVILNKNK